MLLEAQEQLGASTLLAAVSGSGDIGFPGCDPTLRGDGIAAHFVALNASTAVCEAAAKITGAGSDEVEAAVALLADGEDRYLIANCASDDCAFGSRTLSSLGVTCVVRVDAAAD